ncbi:MAG: ABC transporter permease, partial [Theionarchaea archaeon]|nr:ABC transporter permease [Theionarchaea archaeon]
MSLTRFILKRFIEIVVALFLIATLIFILFRLMPGDPVGTLISPRWTAEMKALMRMRFGLDGPLWQQYLYYMKNLLTGDFGISFYWQGNVIDILKPRVIPTILLFTLGTLLAYACGVNLGRIIAWRRGGKFEYGSTIAGLFFFTMPIFWLGLLAIWIFSWKLDLFPVGGMKSAELWSVTGTTLGMKILDV